MQVVVQDVEAQVARPHDAQQGVHIGAIPIDQSAAGVDPLDHFQNVLFEQPQRVGVGEHQPGHRLVALGLQRGQIDVASLVGRQLDHFQPAHGGGSRVGAVG